MLYEGLLIPSSHFAIGKIIWVNTIDDFKVIQIDLSSKSTKPPPTSSPHSPGKFSQSPSKQPFNHEYLTSQEKHLLHNLFPVSYFICVPGEN